MKQSILHNGCRKITSKYLFFVRMNEITIQDDCCISCHDFFLVLMNDFIIWTSFECINNSPWLIKGSSWISDFISDNIYSSNCDQCHTIIQRLWGCALVTMQYLDDDDDDFVINRELKVVKGVVNIALIGIQVTRIIYSCQIISMSLRWKFMKPSS